MSHALKLPRAVEELTAEWLTQALRIRTPGIEVRSASIDKVIWGTATKVLMTLEYAGAPALGGPPQKLCVKGEFDERVRQAMLSSMTITGTQVEADFYNDLAPLLGIPVPHHWFAGSEPGMGALILDNMSVTGFQFGTPTQAWTPALVGKALEILARLHASTWGKALDEIAWLKVGSPAVRQAHEFLMSEAHWNKFQAEPGAFRLPEELQDRERSLLALRRLWQHDDSGPLCVIHGDAHLGNTCIDGSGQPYFIDWAGPCKSSWAFDISYFIVGALTIDDRRANERDLLYRYFDKLAEYGGPVLDRHEAWLDYRRHHLPGLVWTTLPPSMQSADNVQAMGSRYVAAILDHDTLPLLER